MQIIFEIPEEYVKEFGAETIEKELQKALRWLKFKSSKKLEFYLASDTSVKQSQKSS